MIKRIDLTFFKCFEVLKLPTADLTLLSGGNASGKSSILQALALLHQTMREHEWSSRLMLNGDAVRLGTVADVVDKVNGRRASEIGIQDEHSYYRWVFSGERSDMSMVVESVEIGAARTENPEILRHLLPFRSGLAPDPLNTPEVLDAAAVIRAAQHRPDRKTAPDCLAAWATLQAAVDQVATAGASQGMSPRS